MREIGNNIEITVNDLTVSYNDEGESWSSGNQFSFTVFHLINLCGISSLEALKENYRVIAYDVRGHGNSDAGKGDFSIELFANDLLSFMDALKIDKAMLCGLSMGGYIALNAVEKYPDRFDALILSDTTCVADTPEAKEKRIEGD
ncbi:MAG: alpha/beta fold hydrolase [Ignavibacteriales bacterium]|nr:alpha/beta fold hydrolase [Ignavibacteriales bacterium]